MANEFSPEIGSEVSKAEAQKWIDKYDNDHRRDKGKDTKSVFYGRDILLQLLAQHGCAGITFFLASKYNEYAKKDTVQLVLVGRREDGTLLWPDTASGKDGSNGLTVDNGNYCPPYC